MAKITASGVYDLSMDEYHGQPCDALSIGSSGAVILTEQSPAHLKASWEAQDENSKQSDLGTIIHALILEPYRESKQFVVVVADDWRTKAARDQRDAARAAGKTPVLERDLDEAYGAVEAVKSHPVASHLLAEGTPEQSWFAKDKATGLYLKARPDFFTKNRIIVDVKSVASASPEFLKRRVYDGHWFQQAPWYCDVVERVDGEPANGYCWLCVEQKKPHAVVVRRPPETVLMHGHRLNQQAFATFARCVKSGDWPAYGDDIEDLGLPDFAYYRLEEEALKNEPKDMRAVRLARETGAHVFS